MKSNTKYASAERADNSEIRNDFELLSSLEYLGSIFESSSGMAAILNSKRQVVYANDEFLAAEGISSIEQILGSRPGEAVSCIHARKEPGGCGTAEACRYCGAVNAILESQSAGKKVSRESRITVSSGSTVRSLDLLITAAPFNYKNRNFTIVTLRDISNEKRKAGLERIFFHDTINLAGGINGSLKLLSEMEDKNEGVELIEQSEIASADLIEGIKSFKQLTLAEQGDLTVNITPVNSLQILTAAAGITGHHPSAVKRTIRINENSFNINIRTDSSLLSRILVNMLKNALEATAEGGTVFTGINQIPGSFLRFFVKNDGVMPEEVKLQIFQRSFSTKAKDRGLGTYSMKLLGERYLGGSVGFESSPDKGTMFYIDIHTG